MSKYTLVFILALGIAILIIALKNTFQQAAITESQSINQAAPDHEFVIAQAHTLLGFNLVDPGQSPPAIRDSVLRGYRIIMNTPFYAPNYAKDQLSCTNCHFAGGDTIGGKNNGFSLVGVSAVYPRYSKRAGRLISLPERVNACFERSLNGHPLPLDSQEMEDIINYLNWISKEVKHLKYIPWLGVDELKSRHQPSPHAGERIYQVSCAPCHKGNGQGGGDLYGLGKTIPPLWGENSFNDGAGMSDVRLFASFIYWNMPYQNASLTEEEALDVAAFVLKQPRTHFNEN